MTVYFSALRGHPQHNLSFSCSLSIVTYPAAPQIRSADGMRQRAGWLLVSSLALELAFFKKHLGWVFFGITFYFFPRWWINDIWRLHIWANITKPVLRKVACRVKGWKPFFSQVITLTFERISALPLLSHKTLRTSLIQWNLDTILWTYNLSSALSAVIITAQVTKEQDC